MQVCAEASWVWQQCRARDGVLHAPQARGRVLVTARRPVARSQSGKSAAHLPNGLLNLRKTCLISNTAALVQPQASVFGSASTVPKTRIMKDFSLGTCVH
jgi:hypothetical protein